eukprot:5889448-Alexandrium_andersonii.AAC.1
MCIRDRQGAGRRQPVWSAVERRGSRRCLGGTICSPGAFAGAREECCLGALPGANHDNRREGCVVAGR